MSRKLIINVALILALAGGAAAHAQGKKKPARPQTKSLSELNKESSKARADVIRAATEYKESLERLLALQQDEVKRASEEVEKRKSLLASEIISKREVEQSEQVLAEKQAKVEETKSKMGGADTLIAEVRAEEQLAKMRPLRVGGYATTSALIRYNGPAGWSIANAVQVQSFFVNQFGRSLPISAYGQTQVHDRLGFDHRNAIDIAVHPDSAEGRAVMAYLRSSGIPFIAFRHAVSGSATGAHIHIGHPSRRIR
ncbi:MAG TPA: hypothetical protein VF131_08100 [Blastocatellia bacterium]|nr:hypothetical protein [Blastocatellia bacterium]